MTNYVWFQQKQKEHTVIQSGNVKYEKKKNKTKMWGRNVAINMYEMKNKWKWSQASTIVVASTHYTSTFATHLLWPEEPRKRVKFTHELWCQFTNVYELPFVCLNICKRIDELMTIWYYKGQTERMNVLMNKVLWCNIFPLFILIKPCTTICFLNIYSNNIVTHTLIRT